MAQNPSKARLKAVLGTVPNRVEKATRPPSLGFTMRDVMGERIIPSRNVRVFRYIPSRFKERVWCRAMAPAFYQEMGNRRVVARQAICRAVPVFVDQS